MSTPDLTPAGVDELGRLLPHPYYYAPEYAEQRARDAAAREFAGVLGEACRRMMEQHEAAAADSDWWAERAERYAHSHGYRPGGLYSDGGAGKRFWLSAADRWRRDAAEQRELAQVYRWHGVMLGELPSACTCRLPRYCPHVPGQAGYW